MAGFGIGGNRSIAEVRNEPFRASNRNIWFGIAEAELSKVENI